MTPVIALALVHLVAYVDDGWMTPPGCFKMPTAPLFYCNGWSPTGPGGPIPGVHVEHHKPHWRSYARHHYWHPAHWNPREESY